MQDTPDTARLTPPGSPARASWASDLLLSSIIEHLPVAIFAKDVKSGWCFSLWNRAAEKLFGMSAASMLGFNDYDFFLKEKADYFRTTDEQVMKGGVVVDIPEEEITSPRGVWTGHTVKVPIYDAEGKPAILLGIIEDISDRKAALEHYAARLEAEHTTRAKSDFLAHMSHELRTPLNSILGLSGLLMRTRLDDKQHHMLHTLEQASQLLLKTVNDVLDLSKIEAGQVELEAIPFDAPGVFSQSVDLLRTQADEKQLALTFVPPKKTPPLLLGDPARLSRILNNLIGNAIKYTPEGSITVRMDWRASGDGIEIGAEIEDTGIGIPKDKHETVFHQFSQADSSITRKYGGTGLGLCITRELVEMMGGTIGLDSEPGQGARFWFTARFARAHATHTGPLATVMDRTLLPAENTRILLAEDNAMNQIFMTNLLEAHGFPTPDIAVDGEEALGLYDRNAYDCILMDCQMPKLSGYDATRAIRVREKASGRHTPIIALTANALFGERDTCLSAGMDDYLPKPIDLQQFHDLMGRYFLLASNASTQAHAETVHPIDLNYIRQFSGGDADHERHIAALFVRQSDHVLNALRASCIDGPSRPWTEASHFLKGTAASLGAKPLYTLCEKAQALRDTPATDRRALLIPIEAEMRNIRDFLSAEGLLAA